MKKCMMFLLVLVLCLSLCSCGNNRDELYENAIDFPTQEIRDEIFSNKVRAEEKYLKKDIFKIYSKIMSINHDGVFVNVDGLSVFSDFSKKDIKLLSNGEYINFIGRISSIEEKDEKCYVKLDKVQYINNITEISAVISGVYEDFFTINDEEGNLIDTIEFKNGISKDLDVVVSWTKWRYDSYFAVNETEFHNGDKVIIRGIRTDIIEADGTTGFNIFPMEIIKPK